MNLCLFSVGYAGLWGQQRLSLEDFIGRAGELGYDSVMLMAKRPHLSPLDASPERLRDIKAALGRAKVACSVIAGYTDFAGFGASEVPSAEMQIGYVENLSRIAAELCERPIVRIFTAYDSGAPMLWDKLIASLRECCDRAAAHGATVAIQNHHDLAVETSALLELLAEIDRPNCKLGFDAWSPAARGEDLYEAAKKAAPFTVITTNADYVKLPAFRYEPGRVNYAGAGPMLRAVPFGEGFIDYPAFWRGMADGGFRGVMTYEMCSPLRGGGQEANLDHCARSYISWMKARHGESMGTEKRGTEKREVLARK